MRFPRLVLVAAAVLSIAVPSAAAAHTMLTSPAPRDDGSDSADSHKSGPCGGVARAGGQKLTTFAPGAKVNVLVEETVDHRGCFKVQFAAAGDTGWTTLATVDDPTNSGINRANPATYRKVTIPVTLPAAPCEGCTLRAVQLMLGRACTDQDTPEASSTYYSCANIALQPGGTGAVTTLPGGGDGGPGGSDGGSSPDAGEIDSGSRPKDPGGVNTPQDAGAWPPAASPEEGGVSCSAGGAALGAGSGAGAAIGLLVAAAAMARRTRRRAGQG